MTKGKIIEMFDSILRNLPSGEEARVELSRDKVTLYKQDKPIFAIDSLEEVREAIQAENLETIVTKQDALFQCYITLIMSSLASYQGNVSLITIAADNNGKVVTVVNASMEDDKLDTVSLLSHSMISLILNMEKEDDKPGFYMAHAIKELNEMYVNPEIDI